MGSTGCLAAKQKKSAVVIFSEDGSQSRQSIFDREHEQLRMELSGPQATSSAKVARILPQIIICCQKDKSEV
jgi:hypothetical protein